MNKYKDPNTIIMHYLNYFQDYYTGKQDETMSLRRLGSTEIGEDLFLLRNAQHILMTKIYILFCSLSAWHS